MRLMSHSQKTKIIKDLSSFYEVKIGIRKDLKDHAVVDLLNDRIYIQKDTLSQPIDFVLSLVFHELAHLKCKQLKKYPLFHSDIYFLKKKQQSQFLKTVWRAEVYVDKVGSQLMNAHFPGLKFHFGYTKKTKKIFHQLMIDQYKSYFKYLNS